MPANNVTIFLGIDGTGPRSDAEYRAAFQNSFVNRVFRSSSAGSRQYLRGPVDHGFDMAALVAQGFSMVQNARAGFYRVRVFLAGYSRGGSAVIDIARKLQREGVNVDGMALFDAVDRSAVSSGAEIPTNVLRVVQVRRDPLTMSRSTFGNCGNVWHSPTRCDKQAFWCTHGGAGGVPWRPTAGARPTDFIAEGVPEPGPTRVTFDEDRRGSEAAWTWVRPRLVNFGML